MAKDTPAELERDRRPMREAFVKDLYQHLAEKNVTHRELRDGVPGISAHSEIQRWRHGIAEPPPHVVFAIERYLGLAPGTLSVHLGYFPPEIGPAGGSLLDIVEEGYKLPAWGKEILMRTYRQIMAGVERHGRS